ncbi:unnamed protein product [Thelazia callipaeda]|uniref:GRAM domain-containing protein n=1 Tax=Thelazia callipaeda TaxID=103827 RepID=A0A158RBA9_THECL|nr:unnamed protein product [Thelazia callipaeda]
MSVNTSSTPDGRGVLIYNGEMILLYTQDVSCRFENEPDYIFKGNKSGDLYLTSHRVIFINRKNDPLHSFSMPFHCMKDVKLEQPVFGANYLKGVAVAQSGGNWYGQVTWKLTFSKGGCIDFGQALLQAADMAQRFRPYDAPPAYAPPPGNYFAAPPAYYLPPGGNYNGFQAPTNSFPDQPPAGDVYMFEAPPPYSGIGPDHPPVPAGQLQACGLTPTVAMHSMSMSFVANHEETVSSEGNFMTSNLMSDYDQGCHTHINNLDIETNKMDEASSYHTDYSGYQTLGSNSADLNTPAESLSSFPTSYQHLNQKQVVFTNTDLYADFYFRTVFQMSPCTTATSAGQFEHITVMTNLQQLPDPYSCISPNSVPDSDVYSIPNSTNVSAFQICPPSAITQQVQQSVPALNSILSAEMQNRSDYGMERLQTSYANIRTRTAYPLPMCGRDPNRQTSNAFVVNNDGPTVRQHLQQQHRVRVQQQLSLQEKVKNYFVDDFIPDYPSVPSVCVDKLAPVSTAVNLVVSSAANLFMPVNISSPQSMNTHVSYSMNMPVSQIMNMTSSKLVNRPSSQSADVLSHRSMNISLPQNTNMPASHLINTSESQSLNMLASQSMSMPSFHSKNIPPLQSINAHASQSLNTSTSQSMSISSPAPPSSGMNNPIVLQTPRHQYIPHSAPEKPGVMMDRARRMQMYDSHVEELALSYEAQKRRSAELHEEAIQRAAAVYNQIKSMNYSSVSTSDIQVFMIRKLITFVAESFFWHLFKNFPHLHQYTAVWLKSPVITLYVTSKRILPASQVRVTVLGKQSEPAAQQIITESDQVFPIHGIACISQQPRTDAATGASRKDSSIEDEKIKSPWHLNRSARSGQQISESLRNAVEKTGDDVAFCSSEDEYSRKLYFMKRLVKSLVVFRVLAKRLQHHERNRIRRIQTKLKKQAAAKAAKTNESQSTQASVTTEVELEVSQVADIDNYESDYSDKTVFSSGAASPNTSASMSRVETPEPASRNQDFMLKFLPDRSVVQESGKWKMRSGIRRQILPKRTLTDRKDKKLSSS